MAEFNSWRPEVRTRAVSSRQSGSADPPGFTAVGGGAVARARGSLALDGPARVRKEAALRQKALDPAKQAGFMCFMLYMSGNSLQIFSIMMLVSCVYSPIAALANVARAFPPDKQVDVLTPRLIFVAVQLAHLAFAAYKLNSMGLLPTFASDWLSQMPAPVMLERSAGPLGT